MFTLASRRVISHCRDGDDWGLSEEDIQSAVRTDGCDRCRRNPPEAVRRVRGEGRVLGKNVNTYSLFFCDNYAWPEHSTLVPTKTSVNRHSVPTECITHLSYYVIGARNSTIRVVNIQPLEQF